MDFFLEIDDVDITDYIAYGGFRWQNSGVDGPDAGRDMTATLHRNHVADKKRLDITCIPLEAEKARMILNLIKPEWVDIRYYDPRDGVVTKTMYSNNVPASFLMRQGGKEYWGGITFPLVER